MNQGALHFDALLSVNNFDNGISHIKSSIREASGVAKKEAESMDSTFRNLSVAIGGYFSAQTLFAFTKEMINVRGEFQKTEIAFSTMLGSGEKAKALMGQMVDLAAKTPFGLKDVSQGAKQLLAFQVPANEVVDTLTRLGNIASGVSAPIDRIVSAYGKVKATGTLQGDEMNIFMEAGIPIMAELAKVTGHAEGEIKKLVSQGKIGFNDVKEALFGMTNEGGMFFELMEKQSASLSGKVSNLEDTWDQMLNTLGESNEGLLNDGIEGLTYLVENYQKILDVLETLVVTFGAYKAAVIVASAAQSFANKTVQSEIALLSISEKMKLGRAIVTQRQAEATAREAAAEVENVKAKFAALRAENAVLIAKKESLRQAGLSTLAKWQEARAQLSLAQLELSSMQATGTAREIEIAQKRVTIAQNAVISAQGTATIAKNAAIANSVAIWNNKEILKNTSQAIGAAQGAATVASEAAQTAAKNANAIATTRLTIATTLRTSATRLATAAQALLNSTMLNNPIVLVVAAAAALTYAYFKLRDTSTALSIAEKELNEERQRSTKYIDDLKNKTQELTSVINSDTSTKLQQLEAYKQMQAMYPSLLKDMDLEVFKKLGSTEAQKKLNEELDKFSTKNIRDQVAGAQSTINKLNADIAELNQILKKRDGDSGIYLSQLEHAKKNLEAQKIILEKYNTELEERLQNEKISSMTLAEQKKYWEDQINSINKQISALEKTNIKKAEGLDKIIKTNDLVKATALDFLKWNINPLLSQLTRAQAEINKINSAQNSSGVSKNKAYWEAQKKAAAEANDAMSGRSENPRAWDANIKKYREAVEQIKRYDYSDKQLLKDQKERDKERRKLEKGAEKVYLEGSIKRLDQEINLLEDALSRSDGKNVRLRYIDKYGKERDSAEVRSVKSVQDEVLKLREQKAERERMLEVKSFRERTEEAKRQWDNYYRMAEFYGEKTAYAQYKDLFNGAQSYLKYLENQEDALKDLEAQGILTPAQKEDLTFLKKEISELTGTETPFENFKRGVEDAIKNIPSLVDQLNYYSDQEDKILSKNQTNSPEYFREKKYLDDKKREVLASQKELYSTFLKEQETFEAKQLDIQRKYDNMRSLIGQDDTLTDAQRLKKLGEVTKAETKEIAAASFEVFQKTDLWIQAFGDLEKVGSKTLKKLRSDLVAYLAVNGKNLTAEQIKIIQDQIIKFDDISTSRNPFIKVSVAVQRYTEERKKLNAAEKKYGKNSPIYLDQLAKTREALAGVFQEAAGAANGALKFAQDMGNALGGISEEAQQTLNDVQQLVDGIGNAVGGYFSGNYGQMLSGIIQIAGALTKLFNGDRDRERHIKMWQAAVEELKDTYQELQYVIEKTAGDEQIQKQRELISNLKEQQRILVQMRSAESEKKNSDYDKIAGYTQQINAINQQIKELIDDFKTSITTVEFKDLAQKMADALIDAFGQGEDAATSFEKVVDDVMKSAVLNALKIKLLQPVAEDFVNKLYASMGFGGNSGATAEQSSLLKSYQDQIAEIDKKLPSANSAVASQLNSIKNDLLEKIKILNQQIAANAMSGSFDGLTDDEIKLLKDDYKNDPRIKGFLEGVKNINELFDTTINAAQGMKGDIKGITEKTGGALEGQVNALRINVGEVVKLHQTNQAIFKNQLLVQSQIEQNTRPIKDMYLEIKELNSKVKYGAAGIP